jgi:hypothetical protein
MVAAFSRRFARQALPCSAFYMYVFSFSVIFLSLETLW